MDPHSPNKLIATKYCFLILGDDISFFFLLYLFFVFTLFCVILLLLIFKKIITIFFILFIYLLIYLFFHENYLYFFMFLDVPDFIDGPRQDTTTAIAVKTSLFNKK